MGGPLRGKLCSHNIILLCNSLIDNCVHVCMRYAYMHGIKAEEKRGESDSIRLRTRKKRVREGQGIIFYLVNKHNVCAQFTLVTMAFKLLPTAKAGLC